MATVITQGKVQKIHDICGSVIEFSPSELKNGRSSDYLGEVEEYRYLKCPSCGERMYFRRYGKIL